MEAGEDEALGELLTRYEDDAAATWPCTKALRVFRKEGATEEAVGFNAFAPEYQSGERNLPGVLPRSVGFGDESEAAVYFAEAPPGWLKTPGSIDWLRTNAPVQGDC